MSLSHERGPPNTASVLLVKMAPVESSVTCKQMFHASLEPGGVPFWRSPLLVMYDMVYLVILPQMNENISFG